MTAPRDRQPPPDPLKLRPHQMPPSPEEPQPNESYRRTDVNPLGPSGTGDVSDPLTRSQKVPEGTWRCEGAEVHGGTTHTGMDGDVVAQQVQPVDGLVAASEAAPIKAAPKDGEDAGGPARRLFAAVYDFAGELLDLPDFNPSIVEQLTGAFDCWWSMHGTGVPTIQIDLAETEFLRAYRRRASGEAFDFRRAQRDAAKSASVPSLLPDLLRSPEVRLFGLIMRQMQIQINAIRTRQIASDRVGPHSRSGTVHRDDTSDGREADG